MFVKLNFNFIFSFLSTLYGRELESITKLYPRGFKPEKQMYFENVEKTFQMS